MLHAQLHSASLFRPPAVPWANLLCVTDQPGATGNAFGKRLLGDWQLLHGKLPPLLNKYLLGGEQ